MIFLFFIINARDGGFFDENKLLSNLLFFYFKYIFYRNFNLFERIILLNFHFIGHKRFYIFSLNFLFCTGDWNLLSTHVYHTYDIVYRLSAIWPNFQRGFLHILYLNFVFRLLRLILPFIYNYYLLFID